MPRSQLLAVVLVACVAAGCAGEQRCTLIGCTDSLSIELAQASGPWADGSYDLEVVADVTTLVCNFEITAGVLLPDDACAFSLSLTDPSTLQLSDLPIADQIALAVAPTGTTATPRILTPTYDLVQPNGPDCEPTCRQATERIDLSP